ncbi:hypothetical protein C8R47DRAFT_1065009 [Mycena vitilis]|nr:hypothetical protein C8R47DRAFT_1065009 [Mycena vitilis]
MAGVAEKRSGRICHTSTRNGNTATTRIKHAYTPPKTANCQGGTLRTPANLCLVQTRKHEAYDSTLSGQELRNELRNDAGLPLQKEWEYGAKICALYTKTLLRTIVVGWKLRKMDLKSQNLRSTELLELEDAMRHKTLRTESRKEITCCQEPTDSQRRGGLLSSSKEQLASTRPDPHRLDRLIQIDDTVCRSRRRRAKTNQWEDGNQPAIRARQIRIDSPVRIRIKTPLNNTELLRHYDAHALKRHRQIPTEWESPRPDASPVTPKENSERWTLPDLPTTGIAIQSSRFPESGSHSRTTRLPKEIWRGRLEFGNLVSLFNLTVASSAGKLHRILCHSKGAGYKIQRESAWRAQQTNETPTTKQRTFEIIQHPPMPIYSSPAVPRNFGKRMAPSDEVTVTYHPPSPLIPTSDPSLPIPLPSLEPLPCDVLDRRRTGSFGPVDPRLRGSTPSERLADATHGQWLLHRHGQDLPIRPVNLVAPQSIYSGCEYLEHKQEVHKLTVLNARLLVHNPQTGLPTIRTGHAEVEFFAAPSDGAPWPYETPYAPDGKMGRALQKYGPKLRHEVSLHRRKGNFALTLSRHIIKNPKRANLNPADAADNWRTQRTIRAPEPRRPAVASSAIHPQPPTPAPPVINASNASRGYRFLLNPADQPPAKVEDLLPKLGRATNGDRVYVVDPRDEDAPRIDTPGLPSRLVETLPPMASVVPRVPATTLAQQPVHPAITHPTSPVPQAVAVEVEFPAPLSSIDEEDMDVSDEDGDGDDSAMEDVAATPSPLPIPAVNTGCSP